VVVIRSLELFVIIPVATVLLGFLLTYEVRKVFARVQCRYGPLVLVHAGLRRKLGLTRILQPVYDVLKLLTKETIIPSETGKWWFIVTPLVGLALALTSTFFVPLAGFSPLGGYSLSLVILLYLLAGVSLSWVAGAAASSSPWACVGARREAEMMMCYEIPIILSCFSAALLAGSLSITKIVESQVQLPFILLNPPAATALLMGALGKLHLKPFDIPEAEVEVVAGPFTEYSGKLLAVIYLTRVVLNALMAMLFVDLFLAGGLVTPGTGLVHVLTNVLLFSVLCGLVMFVVALIHSLMARFTIYRGITWFVKVAWLMGGLGVLVSILEVGAGW